jgi:hypothetical protein
VWLMFRRGPRGGWRCGAQPLLAITSAKLLVRPRKRLRLRLTST